MMTTSYNNTQYITTLDSTVFINIVLVGFIVIGILLAIFARPILKRTRAATERRKQILLKYFPDKEIIEKYHQLVNQVEVGSSKWGVGVWIWRIITLAFAGIALYLLIRFN